MLSYPVRFIPTEDGQLLVRFTDVPEAAAFGNSKEEALEAAKPILESVLSSYCVDGRPIPAPSKEPGAATVCTEKFSLLGIEIPAK